MNLPTTLAELPEEIARAYICRVALLTLQINDGRVHIAAGGGEGANAEPAILLHITFPTWGGRPGSLQIFIGKLTETELAQYTDEQFKVYATHVHKIWAEAQPEERDAMLERFGGIRYFGVLRQQLAEALAQAEYAPPGLTP